MKQFCDPNTPEFHHWTTWNDYNIPPVNKVDFQNKHKFAKWQLYGSSLFSDLAVHYTNDSDIQEIFLYDDQSRIWRNNLVVDKRLGGLSIGIFQIAKEHDINIPSSTKDKLNRIVKEVFEDYRAQKFEMDMLRMTAQEGAAVLELKINNVKTNSPVSLWYVFQL
jgi:hypothetical protein